IVSSQFVFSKELLILIITFIVLSQNTGIVYLMYLAIKKGNIRQIEIFHFIAICMQGLRIVVPTALILILGANTVRALLEAMPEWLTDGLAIGGGMVVAVGFAMVINMMATKEVWPFFAIGFVL